MISRFRGSVPSNKEAKAVEARIKVMKQLDKSPVRFIEVADISQFGAPVDLGVFPRLNQLEQEKEG